MTTETKKYPAPVYAAAAAGELAYRQLRRLPGRLTELRERVATNELDIKGDLARFGKVAQRSAVAVLDEAKTVYADLVTRGEQVVAGQPGKVHRPATAINDAPATPAKAKATKRTRTSAGK